MSRQGQPVGAAGWLRDRSLTLAMLALFAVCSAGQIWCGWLDHNRTLVEHGWAALTLPQSLVRGHLWEALFENWESEFFEGHGLAGRLPPAARLAGVEARPRRPPRNRPLTLPAATRRTRLARTAMRE
jgi:hypothetical protein